jgi:hypothetical protein
MFYLLVHNIDIESTVTAINKEAKLEMLTCTYRAIQKSLCICKEQQVWEMGSESKVPVHTHVLGGVCDLCVHKSHAQPRRVCI